MSETCEKDTHEHLSLMRDLAENLCNGRGSLLAPFLPRSDVREMSKGASGAEVLRRGVGELSIKAVPSLWGGNVFIGNTLPIVGSRAHSILAASHCTSAAFRRPSQFRKVRTTGLQMSSYVSPDAWILCKEMSSV